jgi:phosphopantothenoylcysteine synthetase/decarboxylase
MSINSNEHLRRPILLVGGAPQVDLDAVRYLSVHATGTTACRLANRLPEAELLLSYNAKPGIAAKRYRRRAELDEQVQHWAQAHPGGLIVMSAAVNDYQLERIQVESDGTRIDIAASGKVPSGADRIHLQLQPAPKLVDQLRQEWGFHGHLVAFKYESVRSVIDSAKALLHRIDASLVVANSIDGSVQALVERDSIAWADNREVLVTELAKRIAHLAEEAP